MPGCAQWGRALGTGTDRSGAGTGPVGRFSCLAAGELLTREGVWWLAECVCLVIRVRRCR